MRTASNLNLAVYYSLSYHDSRWQEEIQGVRTDEGVMNMQTVRSVICVHERYDASWPFTADHWFDRWQSEGSCELYRSEDADARAPQMVPNPETVVRLVLLGLPASSDDLEPFAALEECYADRIGKDSKEGIEGAKERGVSFLFPRGDIQWGQTVAEYALGLTICALRRIPHTSNEMMEGHETWQYSTPGVAKPRQRGAQFGDDVNFANGTIAGKRVRIVGVGNIGGRYAKWCAAMGADVAVWDPFAPEASFDLAGIERCWHLSELVLDSEIFAPMVPLTDSTRGLVTAEHIDALPNQSLVVQVTRARVCDTEALYRRVLKDELFLAADVFDEEPVPLDSPLLGRHNVVHTPHNAGRTINANHSLADDGIARFRPR